MTVGRREGAFSVGRILVIMSGRIGVITEVVVRREHYLSPSPLACYTPAIIDKPLDFNWVKPQGASARSHLDMRKVGPTLAGCVLNHPGDADPQFFRHISCPN